MMPNVAGEASTRRQIFVYSLLLAPIGVLPWALGFASGFYGAVSAALGAGFLSSRAINTFQAYQMKPAKLLFAYSIAYLFAIFAVLLADTIATRALSPTFW